MNIDAILNNVSGKASQYLDTIVTEAPNELHKVVELLPTMKLIVMLMAATMLFGIAFRLLFGRNSSMNRAMSSAIGILFIYAVTIIIHTLNPWKLIRYTSPLPFVVFQDKTMVLLPFRNADNVFLYSQILSLVILCFLVNLLDNTVPQGKTVVGWFLTRVLMVAFSMIAHLFASGLIRLFLPELLVEYAPMALLLILAASLLLGMSKLLLSIVLAAVNPLIGALYAFFFSNRLGKQLTKAVLSTGILCLFFWLLESNGYTVISITQSALLSYIPFGCSLLIIWFMLGHEL